MNGQIALQFYERSVGRYPNSAHVSSENQHNKPILPRMRNEIASSFGRLGELWFSKSKRRDRCIKSSGRALLRQQSTEVTKYQSISNSTYDIHSTISYDYFKLDFKSANFNVINAKSSEINWNEELNSLSVIEARDKFYSIILTITDNEVPKKHIKLSTFPNWFSKNLIDLIFKKKCAHKKYKYHLEINDTCNINTYRYEFFYLRMQCKKEMKNCYNNYLRYVEGSLNNNVKKFWDFIRSKNNTNGYPNKMHLENSYS